MMTRARKPMTDAEARRIVAVKEGICLACYKRGIYRVGCDAHHLLSGGRRIGHEATIGLCAHHHRAVPDDGLTPAQMRDIYGPSLMDGSKTFRAAYGTDAELLDMQETLLRERGVLA